LLLHREESVDYYKIACLLLEIMSVILAEYLVGSIGKRSENSALVDNCRNFTLLASK
jgi:hypothetical protein